MKGKKKRKILKERNFLVPIMRLHCKDGPHLDKKKEAGRKACRVRLRPGVDRLPVFFCGNVIGDYGFLSSETLICAS
jgi:hypothetical protein